MLLAQLAFFVLFVHVIIRPVMVAYLFTRPPRLRVTYRTPADWGAAYRDVEFTGADGIRLEGWYLPPENGAAVILLHGHSGNRLAVAWHAEALSRAGFGVLMFDLRAHGGSGGRKFVRGVAAVDDVLAATAFLSRQSEVRLGIGVMGVSVGGMLAIQAAARHASIRAVAADGPILGTVDDLPPPAGALDRFWRYPLEKYYQTAIDWLTRCPRPPSNVIALARLARRPILLISTGRGLEQRMTRFLYDAAPGPKQLWEIPGAAHATGWAAEPEAYARKLVGFFDRALAVNSLPDEELDAGGPETPESAAHYPDDPVRAERRPIEERTVSPTAAMMIATATIPLAMIFVIMPFQLRWGVFAPRLPEGRGVAILLGLLVLLLAGLLLHELVHLAGYRWFGRVPFGMIRLQFGGVALTPRIRSDVPIPVGAYRRILLLPVLILGVAPGVAAFVSGSWVLLIGSVWMLVAVSGDYIGLWTMRGLPRTAMIRAHPERIGCQVFNGVDSVQNIDR